MLESVNRSFERKDDSTMFICLSKEDLHLSSESAIWPNGHRRTFPQDKEYAKSTAKRPETFEWLHVVKLCKVARGRENTNCNKSSRTLSPGR